MMRGLPKRLAKVAIASVPNASMVLGLLLASGGAHALEIPVTQYNEGGVTIIDWLVIGPFDATTTDETAERDFLAMSGGTELAATPAELKVPVESGSSTAMLAHAEIVDLTRLYGRKRARNVDPSVAYAFAEISVDRDRTAFLLSGSADAATVRLNGQLVLQSRRKRGLYTYDDAMEIKLRRGENLLCLRVPRYNLVWAFTARLELDAEGATFTSFASAETLEPFMLKSGFFRKASEVEIEPRGVPSNGPLDAIVVDRAGKELGRSDGRLIAWSTASPPENAVLRLVIRLRGHEFVETFAIGDPGEMAKAALEVCERLRANPLWAANAETLARRLNAVMTRRTRESEGRGWQRKLVNLITDAETSLEIGSAGKEPFAGRPGLHVRGFQSAIDRSIQQYRLYVPGNATPGPSGWPLIVFLPTAVSAARPFAESPFIEAHNEAERVGALAERYGVAVLWSGYRNQPCGLPIESAHLGEVLDALGRDYSIDKRRITLLGACGGAALAMDSCIRWPGRFAGVGVLNPEFALDETMPESVVGGFSRSKEFRWLTRKTRIEDEFLQLKSPQMFVLHDGGEPQHGDLRESLRFVQRARAENFPLQFTETSQLLAQHFSAWDELFHWASSLSVSDCSDNWRTRPLTLQEAVTEPFVVVRGTVCDATERQLIDQVVQSITNSWSQTNFADCQIVADSAVSGSEYAKCNLVLVGGPKTNSVWRALGESVGVRVNEHGVGMCGKNWAGDSLSFQAAVNDPSIPNRKLVLIGVGPMGAQGFPTLNLARDGWYRCAIWRSEPGGNILLFSCVR